MKFRGKKIKLKGDREGNLAKGKKNVSILKGKVIGPRKETSRVRIIFGKMLFGRICLFN